MPLPFLVETEDKSKSGSCSCSCFCYPRSYLFNIFAFSISFNSSTFLVSGLSTKWPCFLCNPIFPVGHKKIETLKSYISTLYLGINEHQNKIKVYMIYSSFFYINRKKKNQYSAPHLVIDKVGVTIFIEGGSKNFILS